MVTRARAPNAQNAACRSAPAIRDNRKALEIACFT